MPTVLLVRHGRTAANASGRLAGRTPGVVLDETGTAQVQALAERLAPVPLVAVVASPLERCQATAAALAARSTAATGVPVTVTTDERLSECDYGEWTNRPIAELTKEELWKAVQAHPASVVFPGGEAMATMQHRALAAVREMDARVLAEHGEHAVWAAVSHGDVIKSVLADALGTHLDHFQRIVVDPASVSAVRYSPLRPFAVRVNDTGGDVAALLPPPPGTEAPSSDAVVGGGAGAGPAEPAGPGASADAPGQGPAEPGASAGGPQGRG